MTKKDIETYLRPFNSEVEIKLVIDGREFVLDPNSFKHILPVKGANYITVSTTEEIRRNQS